MPREDQSSEATADPESVAHDIAVVARKRGITERISKASRVALDLAGSGSAKVTTLATSAYDSAIDAKDSVKGKALGAGKVALAGAGVTVATTLAVKGLKAAAKTKGFDVLKPLGKGNLAANMVDAGITVGHQSYKLYKGETTKSEMAHACAEKGTGMLASVGGAGLGAMAAVALALPTGGASLLVGGASMLAGYAGPKAYKAGRTFVGEALTTRDSSREKTTGADAPADEPSNPDNKK